MKTSKLCILFFSFLFLFLSFGTKGVFGAEEECETKKDFSLYTCRVKKLCETYDTKKPVYKTESYEDAESFRGVINGINTTAFDTSKEIYRKNIGTIYKCALIYSQKQSLTIFKEKFLKLDKTGVLNDKIGRKIESDIQKADLSGGALGCLTPKETGLLYKKNIWDQSILEMCKYHNYLEYLKVYYKNIDNVFTSNDTDTEKEWSIVGIDQALGGMQSKIEEELLRTYKILPIVFHAYVEYEDNLVIHLFLQIIREDFIVVRDVLYQAINPINQVVYKISNAMMKR